MKALGFRVCGLGLGLSCVLRQDSACGMIPDSGLRTGECRLKGIGSNILGRALGHFVFSLIGLKRILFTNIFQKL